LHNEKLGERERKALFPSEGKGHDDDYDEHKLHERYMKNEEIHTTKAFVNTWYLLGSVLTSWTSPSTNFL